MPYIRSIQTAVDSSRPSPSLSMHHSATSQGDVMEIFDGLLQYEIILLVLGVILFLVLLFLLIYLVMKQRAFKQLIPLFLIPIVMIGFPSIQKIKYDNGIVEIEKATKSLSEQPSNEKIKADLDLKIQNIQSRAATHPTGLMAIANARLALGDTVKARQSINSALTIRPDLPAALHLKKQIGH
jgi:hypothetical protein